MLSTALCTFVMIIWWFGAGPFLIFFNGIAHSETNCLISWAKRDGTSTFKLRVYQVLHCIGYAVWITVLITIPFLFKYYEI